MVKVRHLRDMICAVTCAVPDVQVFSLIVSWLTREVLSTSVYIVLKHINTQISF